MTVLASRSFGYPREVIEGRFWPKVRKTDGCWEWQGQIRRGWGRFQVKPSGRPHSETMAHRVAYELVVGPIPKGLSLDHLCHNRRCVNPSHLEPVTLEENGRRANQRYYELEGASGDL